MEGGKDERKRSKAICLTPSFLTNLGGGREKKVYESLNLFSRVNQTVSFKNI